MTSHVLHLGDCLDPVTGLAALADKSVDHVLADPPYSERVHKGAGMARDPESEGSTCGQEIDFAHLTHRDRLELARQYNRIARRWILVFCDEESVLLWKVALERAGAEWCVKGTWNKEQAQPRMDGTRPAYGTEAICIAHARPHKGKTRWNGGGKVATWSASIQEPNRKHPTQKPLLLIEALLRDFTDPGDLILDSHAGSGTTLVAAKRLGRNATGWEGKAEYHAIAEKRIASAREQLGLWTGAA